MRLNPSISGLVRRGRNSRLSSLLFRQACLLAILCVGSAA
ncbi:MAG: hypothetical protein HW398_815, partial [Acidobacteria bacterium]|nr:hypothetical protein [Acidobacteriota bacterium]